MATITYAPERAVYSLEDGMESAGPLTLVSNPAEYIRLDLHEAAVAAARAEGIDAVEQEVKEWLAAPSISEQAAVYDQACHDILRYIVALKVRP